MLMNNHTIRRRLTTWLTWLLRRKLMLLISDPLHLEIKRMAVVRSANEKTQ